MRGGGRRGPGGAGAEAAARRRCSRWRNVETLRRLALLAERRTAACCGRAGDDLRRRGDRVRPNGLVAANQLVDAGWSVLVLEAQPTLGGAVASAEDVQPGFVHDTFSSFYPLAAASPTMPVAATWRTTGSVAARPGRARPPLADGGWALLHQDREVTAAAADDEARRRRRRVAVAVRRVGRRRRRPGRRPDDPVPADPVRAVSARRGFAAVGGLGFVRTMLTPAAELGRAPLRRRGPRLCSWPGTPPTPTSPSTPRARG